MAESLPLHRCVLINMGPNSVSIVDNVLHFILEHEKPEVQCQYRASLADIRFLVEERTAIHVSPIVTASSFFVLPQFIVVS